MLAPMLCSLSLLGYNIAPLPSQSPAGPWAATRPALTGGARAPSMVAVAPEVELKSEVGFDFVPLLTALQAADFLEADQLTRDGLIKLAGDEAVKRGYVYFTEVPKLPMTDMITMERLWLAYSGGKFGYSVQSKIFETKKVNKKFEPFFERLGWTNEDGGLLRWLPDKGNEFCYDLEKAKEGHLPLTSTLRGTQLLKGLMAYPAWKTEEFFSSSK